MSDDILSPPSVKRGRPRKCPAYPAHGKHKFTQVKTERCQNGQWQNVCACGEMADDVVYGEAIVQPPSTTVSPSYREISLDDKNDVDCIVDALFDSNLDWTNAILKLLPVDPKEARTLADEWSQDKRVIAAVDAYVESMAASNKKRYALLTHHCWKAIQNSDETGAVRATAMNILKSAHVTEKSEQQFIGPMLIQGLKEGLERMMSGDDKPSEDAPEEELPTKLVQ